MAAHKKKIKMTTGNIIFVVVFCTVLVLYSLSMIYPLLWGLNTSLKSKLDFSVAGNNNVIGFPTLTQGVDEFGIKIPDSINEFWHLANYKKLFVEPRARIDISYSYYCRGVEIHTASTDLKYLSRSAGFPELLSNTLIFCGVACVLKAFVPAIAAYFCAKYKYKSSSIIYYFLLVMMTIPIVGTQPAELNMLRNLGIYSTWFQHVLQTCNMTGIYFFVFFAYFQGLSDTYMEAAEIDGASQFRIITSIVIPLSIKSILAVMLLTFVTYWNNYSTPEIYYPTYPTLALMVQRVSQVGQGVLDTTPARCAACMLLAIPLLILFLCFHKQLMGNVSLGGIKE